MNLLKERDVFVITKELKDKHGFPRGTYVVTKTQMTGGGTGHGPHDVYPDGHHVTAMSMEEDNAFIQFYQTGCFINMIEDVKPIGQARVIYEYGSLSVEIKQ